MLAIKPSGKEFSCPRKTPMRSGSVFFLILPFEEFYQVVF
jgi:hypothetical protein